MTQARALLRLVPEPGAASYGEVDLASDEDREFRRARGHVQAIAERRPFGDRANYLWRARVALRDLCRLASVDREAFGRECTVEDALEREVMADALAWISSVKARPVPTPPPVMASAMDVAGTLGDATGETKPDGWMDRATSEAATHPDTIDNPGPVPDTRANAHNRSETS